MVATFLVNLKCDDPKLEQFMSALETQANIYAGEWTGSIKAAIKTCDNKGEKRDTISEVQTTIAFNGPYARTTRDAVRFGMEDTTIDAGDGVYGEYMEADGTNSVRINDGIFDDDKNFDDDDHDLSDGQIAGIVIGSVAGAAFIFLLIALVIGILVKGIRTTRV
jgi:hypothetical protein